MTNRWNERDLLRLTRDCDLGLEGEQLHVVAVDGPYMTARHSGGLFVRTGRDYVHASKIGEAAVDWRDKPTSGDVVVTSSRAATVSQDGLSAHNETLRQPTGFQSVNADFGDDPDAGRGWSGKITNPRDED